MSNGVVSLALSSQAWTPATSPSGEPLPMCVKHAPELVVVTGWDGKVRRTVYRCSTCGAGYTVAEVSR